MTTVAYKDGIIAVDSLTLSGDVVWSNKAQKIIPLGGKNFIAGSGVVLAGKKLADWIKQNGLEKLADAGVHDRSNQYLCWFNGELYFIDSELWPSKLDKNSYYALGSGREIALGVMSLKDSTALQAVKASIELDVYSGGKANFRRCLS